MDINMQVTMKVPGPCKAWLEERHVWDIPAKTKKERENQESKKAWWDEYGESIDDVQYSELCLCWDINNKFATVSGNPYSHVLSLYKEVNIDKKMRRLLIFGEILDHLQKVN